MEGFAKSIPEHGFTTCYCHISVHSPHRPSRRRKQRIEVPVEMTTGIGQTDRFPWTMHDHGG